MKRLLIATALAFSLILAACGGGDTAATQTTSTEATSAATEGVAAETAPPATAAPETTQAGVAPSTENPAEAVTPSGVDGPAAPDFTFALDDGSTFVLSEGAKPVYMVFWAEW